jgi:hypothetical protein
VFVRYELKVFFTRSYARKRPDEQSDREDFVISWNPKDELVEKIHAVDS